MRNIFLEKLYTQCGGKASPIPFYKKSKSSKCPDQQLEFVFIECSREDVPDLFINIFIYKFITNVLIFILHKAFLKGKKDKKRSGTSFPDSFSV